MSRPTYAEEAAAAVKAAGKEFDPSKAAYLMVHIGYNQYALPLAEGLKVVELMSKAKKQEWNREVTTNILEPIASDEVRGSNLTAEAYYYQQGLAIVAKGLKTDD